jgi:AcrR family transcriptional regulator
MTTAINSSYSGARHQKCQNRLLPNRPGEAVRVSKEKSAENRERILEAAARLFRERGLSGVGVDALTEAAGLTHGSLYSQFGSKERLAAEALVHALTTSSARMRDARTLNDYMARYLSADHREGLGDGCVIAALAAKCRARAPRSGTVSPTPFEDDEEDRRPRTGGAGPTMRRWPPSRPWSARLFWRALSTIRELSGRILGAARPAVVAIAARHQVHPSLQHELDLDRVEGEFDSSPFGTIQDSGIQ